MLHCLGMIENSYFSTQGCGSALGLVATPTPSGSSATVHSILGFMEKEVVVDGPSPEEGY